MNVALWGGLTHDANDANDADEKTPRCSLRPLSAVDGSRLDKRSRRFTSSKKAPMHDVTVPTVPTVPRISDSVQPTTQPTKLEILTAAAEACLSEGWAILPLTPNGKTPLPCTVNEQGHVRRWHNGVHSVYSASFGPVREYVAPKTGKIQKTTLALQAWWDGLESNPAIALELSGMTALDIDDGISDENELLAFMSDFNIPITRAIRSGRTSSFGVHLLYKGVTDSGSFAIEWRDKTVKGEVKSRDKYVAAEGSFHKSGNQYIRLWDTVIAETPVPLFADILKNHTATKVTASVAPDAAAFEGTSITPEQFEAWAEKNGEAFTFTGFHEGKQAAMYTRDAGCPWAEKHTTTKPNEETDFAVFIPIADGKLSAVCVHESCKAAWNESSCWKSYRTWLKAKNGEIQMQPTGKVLIGKLAGKDYVEGTGDFPNGSGVTTEHAMSVETPTSSPSAKQHTPLAYPVDAWKGTLYHEYAELCTHGNYIPREFFIESLKTVVGAVAGKKLEIQNIDGGTPRFYTVLIALPSAGKNTVITWTTSLFEKDIQQAGSDLKDFGQYQLLWHPQEIPSNPELGACVTQVSSASGLAKFLPSAPKGVAQERLLFKYTELASLLEKCGIDGSGTALISALCDLYDGTEFSVPALSEQKPFGGHLQLSILSGIQPERWAELGSGKGVENSGIHSRWNLVPSEESKTVSDLERPDLSLFQTKIRERLSQAIPLIADSTARAAMKDWHGKVTTNEPNKAYLARLNIIAWRNALHHSWLLGKPVIDADSVAVGIAVADYQLLARKRYAPLVGDSPLDKAINAIRNRLQRDGAITMSQLKRGVNYKRLNQTFEKALAFLFRMGEVDSMNGLIRLKEVSDDGI
jgi:hypothetical protein